MILEERMAEGDEILIPAQHALERVGRRTKPESTIIEVGGVRIGEGEIVVMAGPCSVESEEQLLATARAVKASGAKILRGGAFKPRTSPYSFQGLKVEGLELLALARQETGLAVVTELMDLRYLDVTCDCADILQVGSRNMQNYVLLEEIGKCRKPVLLKRGMSSTVEELLLAAEYVLKGGNEKVMLCERGIRTFETATRNTCDISAIPVLNELTHLPVILDPSHATGKRSLVPAVARAGVAVGADGLIIEAHPAPEKAVSDGAQSLELGQFSRMMQELQPYIELWKASRTRELAAVAS